MVTKKKVSAKKAVSEETPVKDEIPEGMEGKARYTGVPIEEYASRLLASQSVSNSATEKAGRIESGLFGQGYDVSDIRTVVNKIMQDLIA